MEQPTTIGRYQILDEIGRGGMATVYRAFDPLVRRDVAIKLLPREFMHNPDFRQRFEQEARTIATLEHPAIVPIYDFGEDGDQPFIVMRLLTGGTLSDRIRQNLLSLTEIARIMAAIAPGLDRAHAQGIIHRDIKPANILFDGFNNPYLSDFGLVKMMTGEGIAADSGMFGTPEYMAPEMAQRGQINRMIDIYALGVTIYEALTGKPPFSADTPVGLLMAHATEPIPRLNDSLPDLPEAVQEVMNIALAKNTTDRYQNATDLATDLEAIAATGKTQKLAMLRRDRTPELAEGDVRRLRQPPHFERIVLGVGAVVVIGGVIGGLAMSGVFNMNGATPTSASAEITPIVTASVTPDQPSETPTVTATDGPTPTVQPTANPQAITLSSIREVQPLKRLAWHTDIVNSVAWSPSGQLASASADKRVILWNIEKGEPEAVLEKHSSWVKGLKFSPDGKQIVSTSSDHTAIIWDIAKREPVDTITTPLFGLNGVDWSADGQRLIFSPYFTDPILYSVRTGQMVRELKGHTYQVNAVAFSPDSNYIASGAADARVIIWDALTGDSLRVLNGHTQTVLTVAWSPDGTQLISGSEDRRVIIWDPQTGEVKQKLVGHTGPVTSVTWSPDGSIIASASADGQVRLWDAKSGEPLRVLDGGSGPVLSIAWSPDGSLIATGQSNYRVIVWGRP